MAASKYSLLVRLSLLKKVLIFSAFFYAQILNASPVFASGAECPPPRIDESVKVRKAYDGDTLQLRDGRKVRLIGIDTPETYSRKRQIPVDIQKQGKVAHAALQALLEQSDYRLGLTYGVERFDRYGRTLAHAYLPDGRNLQAWMISRGYGIAFTTPPNDRMSDCYQKQEMVAEQAGLGIWQMPQYQLKTPYQLTRESSGFHRVEGVVTDIWQTSKHLTLLLNERLELRIYKEDLKNFDLYRLKNSRSQKIQVRGWIRYLKQKQKHAQQERYRMTLRHSDSIKLQK